MIFNINFLIFNINYIENIFNYIYIYIYIYIMPDQGFIKPQLHVVQNTRAAGRAVSGAGKRGMDGFRKAFSLQDDDRTTYRNLWYGSVLFWIIFIIMIMVVLTSSDKFKFADGKEGNRTIAWVLLGIGMMIHCATIWMSSGADNKKCRGVEKTNYEKCLNENKRSATPARWGTIIGCMCYLGSLVSVQSGLEKPSIMVKIALFMMVLSGLLMEMSLCSQVFLGAGTRGRAHVVRATRGAQQLGRWGVDKTRQAGRSIRRGKDNIARAYKDKIETTGDRWTDTRKGWAGEQREANYKTWRDKKGERATVRSAASKEAVRLDADTTSREMSDRVHRNEDAFRRGKTGYANDTREARVAQGDITGLFDTEDESGYREMTGRVFNGMDRRGRT